MKELEKILDFREGGSSTGPLDEDPIIPTLSQRFITSHFF